MTFVPIHAHKMKAGLLTIFIVSVTAQFTFSQNVRIIRASDRSTVSNPVIIPTPPKANDTVAVAKKSSPTPAASASSKKNSNVKSVRGSNCKKPCIKKVCSDKKSSAKRSNRTKQVETTKK
jgi:hypothetical protein